MTNDYMGEFTVKFVLRSELGELAQLPISVFMDNIHKDMFLSREQMENG